MKQVVIGNRTLTDTEKTELYLCISARLGFIETGEVSMRAVDAHNSGQTNKIKPLTLEQRKLTILLEELMQDLI